MQAAVGIPRKGTEDYPDKDSTIAPFCHGIPRKGTEDHPLLSSISYSYGTPP